MHANYTKFDLKSLAVEFLLFYIIYSIAPDLFTRPLAFSELFWSVFSCIWTRITKLFHSSNFMSNQIKYLKAKRKCLPNIHVLDKR